MAGHTRAFDWSTTPLGPSEAWPLPLRTAVEMMLASPMLATLAVGPERVFLYNDEAARHYGGSHPGVLGLPLAQAFAHEFADIAPFYDRVFGGESLHVPAQPLDPGRRGAAEVFDAYLTPVREVGGGVIAAHMTGFAVGERLQAEARLRASEERQAFLLRLSDALRPVGDPVEVQRIATRMLGQHLGATRVFYVAVGSDGDTADILHDYTDGVPSRVGRYSLQAFSSSALREWRAGRTASTDDVEDDTRYSRAEREAYASVSTRAGFGVPLIKEGRLVALLGVNQATPRHWSDDDIEITGDVAERTWTAVERARAETALRESEEERRSLITEMNEGFCILEVILNDNDRGVDYRFLETNPAFVRQGGFDPAGRLMSEIAPIEPVWPAAYGRVAATGVPERIVGGAAAFGRIYEVYAFRIGKSVDRRIAVFFTDITARTIAEERLRESEEQQRLTLQLVPAMLWSADPAGHLITADQRWKASTGLGDADVNDFGWLDAVHPDDREATQAAFAHAYATGEPIERQHRIHHVGDGYRWHLVRHVPVRDESGAITRWFGAAIDVHDLHELQDRQDVLVAELQHRTRNLIAVVKGIANDMMEETGPTDAFRAAFSDRLSALSRVQGLLSRAEAEPITIGNLLRLELDAVGATVSGARVTTEGPEVYLRPSTVQTLALALHELATNARKHGALSHEGGRLAVTWRKRAEAGECRLAIEWVETGLEQATERPALNRPGGGYGRELIEHALPHTLGARTSYALTASGVRCTIDLVARPGT
ncbi:HWE histidine kinase domain-containing protein [Lichenibacterium dinghuense]|uniref:HWE histidine kinase domain-containing protein n=1 Tax=Lichenibacterium dinghuense TaxID=2895977 RepID=UPI001F027FB9|nr:HWE histidine kinase domain-containing protein [Lichenibacterium sp. 6Y81]